MPEPLEVADLLASSQSRWRTLRAEGREWRNHQILHAAWEAMVSRWNREKGGATARATAQFVADQDEDEPPDEGEEEWRLWLAPPWKRAQFCVGSATVNVVFHGNTWWSNSDGKSITNGGALNVGHGEGYGADLIRTAVYVPLLNIEETTSGTRLGRATIEARATAREDAGFARHGLHGLMVGDADYVVMSVDAERGVLLRTEAWFNGKIYRVVEMTQVGFDEEFTAETFEIQPLPGLDWSVDPF
jgi:hypothetical protein